MLAVHVPRRVRGHLGEPRRASACDKTVTHPARPPPRGGPRIGQPAEPVRGGGGADSVAAAGHAMTASELVPTTMRRRAQRRTGSGAALGGAVVEHERYRLMASQCLE